MATNNISVSSNPQSPTPLIAVNAAAQLPHKLTPTNFPAWRLVPLLMTRPLSRLHIRTGYARTSSYSTPILAGVSEGVVSHIANAETSMAAWKTLTRLYASRSRTRVMQLKEDLTLLQRGSRSVTEFLHSVKHIADELALIDAPVPNDDLTLYILNGLGSEYREIVAPIRTRATSLTFEELHDLLLGTIIVPLKRMTRSKPILGLAILVAFFQSKPTNNSSADSAPRGRQQGKTCHFCGFSGHTVTECRKLRRVLAQANKLTALSCLSLPPTVGCLTLGHLITSHLNFKTCPCILNMKDLMRLSLGMAQNLIPSSFSVKDLSTGVHLLQGKCEDGIYYMPQSAHILRKPPVAFVGVRTSLDGWHSRLGHPSTKMSGVHLQLHPSMVIGFTLFSLIISQSSLGFYPLKQKSDVESVFINLQNYIKNQFATTIKHLYTDNGGEYLKLRPFLAKHGITSLTTPPHTPQHNGVSERRHRHLVETGLTLLHHSKLPLKYWSFAFEAACYLINRMPTPLLHGKTPFESLTLRPPNYLKLRTFGCLCYPWLKPYNNSKLDPKSTPCIFLGYSLTQSAYKCLDIKDPPPLSFFAMLCLTNTPFLTPPTLLLVPPSLTLPEVLHPPAPPDLQSSSPGILSLPSDNTTLSSSPAAPAPPPPHRMTTRSMNNIYKPKHMYLVTKHPLPDTLEPTCVSQALKHPQWRHAMSQEFTALVKHGTWDLVPPQSSQNQIGCKWVFRIKRKPDGSIDRYKARLVAKGFHQRPGLDYTTTFSPVVKPTTIRTVLSIALMHRWPIRQLDVNNAFLHGTLEEDVFMTQPRGFVDSNFPNYVCKLKKSIYGLKQAPRAWYNELKGALLDLHFSQSKSDPSLFIYHAGGHTMYFLVYVDDLLITGSSTLLHQYIRGLLDRVKMDGAKDVQTPQSTSITLKLQDGSSLTDATTYRQVIGALQYLSFTRPDIAFSVNKLAQFMHQPTATHWTAAKRILRYLKHTIHHGLHLTRTNSSTLQAYSDADWAGNFDDRSSTTAYLIFLGNNLISWSTRKQRAIARSSTEAEYRALAATTSEIAWLTSLLSKLHLPLSKPPLILCDNIGATQLSLNPVMHSRMKHIAIDLHFVRDYVNKGLLDVRHVSTHDQFADLLTKALPKARFHLLKSKIGVLDGTSILRGCISDNGQKSNLERLPPPIA
uniref:Integrase catalytic domain-containing protein n=1 Tax=Fagus sylvatica TaxID=28930 RepID=A0A2N9GCF6_FAGSY